MSKLFKLRGEIEEGMFPNEVLLIVTDFQGAQHTLIVPKDVVEQFDGAGTVWVRAIDASNGLVLIRLPGESIDGGIISVKESDLSPV